MKQKFFIPVCFCRKCLKAIFVRCFLSKLSTNFRNINFFTSRKNKLLFTSSQKYKVFALQTKVSHSLKKQNKTKMNSSCTKMKYLFPLTVHLKHSTNELMSGTEKRKKKPINLPAKLHWNKTTSYKIILLSNKICR